jgi:pimeloyl-ACP methyl ester carboxylesterase
MLHSKMLTSSIGILILLTLQSCKSYLFYQAPRYDESELNEIKSEPRVVEISYDMPFGRQTSFYIKPLKKISRAPQSMWILFGGINAGAFEWFQWFKDIPDSNCALLLIEYPGYGKCEGVPRDKRILASSLQAFTELAKYLDVPRELLEVDLGLLGHSLGTLTVMEFAPYVHADKILLISPISTLDDEVKSLFGDVKGSLVNVLNPEAYNNIRQIKLVLQKPDPPKIIIIHGDQDEIVPVRMGRELAALSDSIEYHEIPGAGHPGLIKQEIDLIKSIMFR